jgi:hypothetical protein
MASKQNHMYVRYTSRPDGKIDLEKGTPKNLIWAVLDQDNGNPELGFGYLWLFEAHDDALTKLQSYLDNKDRAVALCGPFHIKHINRDFLCMARFDFEPSIYKSYIKSMKKLLQEG